MARRDTKSDAWVPKMDPKRCESFEDWLLDGRLVRIGEAMCITTNHLASLENEIYWAAQVGRCCLDTLAVDDVLYNKPTKHPPASGRCLACSFHAMASRWDSTTTLE